MAETTIAWLRSDLRLEDNEVLCAKSAVVPVFIWAPEEESTWQPGAASRWWLHQSLRTLEGELRKLGSRLIIRRGPAVQMLSQLAKEAGATAVRWNRRYEPAAQARDAKIAVALQSSGLTVETFNGSLLHEPSAIRNSSGRPFQVFTPFWKCCLSQSAPALPLPALRRLLAPKKWPESLALDALELEPKIDWASGLRAVWTPGEAGARAALARFANVSADYPTNRDRPDLDGTSRLSPHLHFGEISPRQVWRAMAQEGDAKFLTELGWREFAHYLLHHFPHTPTEPLRAEFKKFPWRRDAEFLHAWQKGRTGYPIVDAGMRQLWSTGWMHNRVRMIVASFLVKDLLISWTEGARWFWDTLVDADLANNTLGWQWSAGCGADAAPYFRIFNPITQGEKFDPLGKYVRQWCPELATVPDKWVHQPWNAPDGKFAAPIVNHRIAREVALEAFARRG